MRYHTQILYICIWLYMVYVYVYIGNRYLQMVILVIIVNAICYQHNNITSIRHTFLYSMYMYKYIEIDIQNYWISTDFATLWKKPKRKRDTSSSSSTISYRMRISQFSILYSVFLFLFFCNISIWFLYIIYIIACHACIKLQFCMIYFNCYGNQFN